MVYTWKEVDALLHKWLGDPEQLADDGIDAPTRGLIASAIQFHREFQPFPPTSIGPTPEGGISFEWRRGDLVEIAEIVRPGEAEHTRIRGRHILLDELLKRNDDGAWLPVETNDA